jgi:hypothetical protein
LLNVIVIGEADESENENHTSSSGVPEQGAVIPPPEEAVAALTVPVLSVTPSVRGVAPAHSSLPGPGIAHKLM